ncbi:MAG: cardiolipin synthase [Oscillospiraceae bacterium]|nr:cardiolipin synthase [Oscillospiraceae bacterium]
MDKRWFRKLFTRRIFVAVMILIQIALLWFLVRSGSEITKITSVVLTVTSILVALYIVSQPDKIPYKMTWIFIILALPVFGGLLYIVCKFQGSSRKTRVLLRETRRISGDLFAPESGTTEEISLRFPEYTAQARYLSDHAGFPVCDASACEYLSPGERFYERVLEELRKAEKYIFIECFIIQHGVMWDPVLDILSEKASAGLDVRIMYDDMGCFFRLPSDYSRTLGSKGIKCMVFNPFRPFLSAIQNNRDHRKIVSIDGKVAFTGGSNFADEYINAKPRFGHWKDASVMVTGKAALSLTAMFLEMWSALDPTADDRSLLHPQVPANSGPQDEGYLIPYSDSPTDKEHVGANVFLHMITCAKKNIYINTPYLILDDTLLGALMLRAKSGVDVRIITPGIADKPLVHATTRCYYRHLIGCGAKIYEYSPGFIHSKTIAVDGNSAIVGTANFDYRSLYLHFECGVWMVGCRAAREIEADFLDTLDKCRPITEDDCKKNIFVRFTEEVLRLFSPIM